MALHSQDVPAIDLAGIALCAGVGGLELGLHIAEPGYRTVCYVERDAFAAATLVARMDDEALDRAPIWSDLRAFDGRPWRGKVHLLTAGYPCQPFSAAGPRRGAADPRHLWPEVARVAAEADVEWIFCENVEGHLNLGLPEVLADLRGMGYEPKAGLFSALEVGASHLRRRIFILAHSNRHGAMLEQGGHRVEREGTAVPAGDGPDRQAGVPVARHPALEHDGRDDAPAGGSADGAVAELPLFPPPPFDLAAWDKVLECRMDLLPEFFGLDDGLAYRVERSHAVGNGVVSLAAAYAWRTLRAAFGDSW